MSHDPNHGHDADLDRALHDAFASRHVPLVDRPSMVDVQRRARRRNQRRSAAMVGCTAVVALGGAGLWAARQDEPAGSTADTLPGLGTANTICDVVYPTTIPAFEVSGSTIAGIATTTAVYVTVPLIVTVPGIVTSTILENAETIAPAGTTTTGLPTDDPASDGTTTTMFGVGEPATSPPVAPPAASTNCYPVLPAEWHCTGPLGTDSFGRDVYEYCEPASQGWATTVVPTTAVVDAPLVVPTTDAVPTTPSTIAIVETTSQG
ncbi:MAG: hypothetical protein ACOYMR_15545 [Ilumatobacteraceae bacterium]